MKPKFEIGDRVIYKPCKMAGTVINIYRYTGICVVSFDEEMTSRYIHENDLEFENPKAVFLARLQKLLAEFDAKISGGGFDGYGDYLICSIGQGEPFGLGVEYEYGTRPTVTAENIFDYDND